MLNRLLQCASKPPLYAPSTRPFWDDEHISMGMLEAHLNPTWDAATRNHAFVDRSARWIAQILPPSQYPRLLDLGCGPGLYAERFCKAGYAVTGIDFSRRSIAYAKEQAARHGSAIDYRHQNYLTLDGEREFDVVTLIYCDYATLSHADRLALLERVHRALRPGGRFLVDVFAKKMRHPESHTWYRAEEGGFYSPKSHICMEAIYQYDDEDETELMQAVVVAEDAVECYHIWDHFFDREKLIAEASAAGFHAWELYGNVAGDVFSEEGETICGVFVG